MTQLTPRRGADIETALNSSVASRSCYAAARSAMFAHICGSISGLAPPCLFAPRDRGQRAVIAPPRAVCGSMSLRTQIHGRSAESYVTEVNGRKVAADRKIY